MAKTVKKIKMPNGEELGLSGGIENKLTNCLLEVPQRVKLELNNGTLTLKAGSQVIVPNGFEEDGVTPRFDYVDIESDLEILAPTNTSGIGKQYMICFVTDSEGNIGVERIYDCESGDGSSYTNNWEIYYNTVTNRAYTVDGGVDKGNTLSLPIALIITDTVGVWKSIDQTFNGMGYIGSTIWVDKGVKGLIPNGRNEDGTLRNIEYTNNKISISTFTGGYADTFWLRLCSNGTLPNHSTQIRYNIKSFSNAPTPTVGKWYSVYVEDENMFYYSNNGGAYYKDLALDLGVYSSSVDNKITSLNPKLPFRAVDWSDGIRITETYVNGTSWYRVYSDGWCEQGGAVDSISASPSIAFLIPFKTDYFSLLISQGGNAQPALGFANPTRTGFLWTTNSGERSAVWQAKGYIV